ncbi:MAG: AAA family ATPase, partial [Candidatus Methanoperedens sp.]|nr:AAA family ATPase [Candidatus Methanoperedens sp.]
EDLKGVTVLGATNRLDMIDPALLRPGRFDLLIEVPLPDEHELMEIFKVHSRQKPLGKGINYNILIKQMPGFTGADVASICREAAMIAIQEYIDNKGELEKPDFKIHQRHFEEVINAYRKRHEISGEK